MTLSIKDPGSALTHFIGMILAGIAAVPLLAVAASNDSVGAVAAFAIFAPAWCFSTLPAQLTTLSIFQKK